MLKVLMVIRAPLRAFPIAVLALLTAAPTGAHAWGKNGHKIVARLAAARLTPAAQEQVGVLLGVPKSDLATKLPAALANVANWADGVRFTTRPDTYNWHFADIPVNASHNSYDATRDCKLDPEKGDCVISGLTQERDALADSGNTKPRRLDALRFVTHLVGDMHQPLHCAERNHDSGANGVKVIFFGETTDETGENPWNLHHVWDVGLIDNTGLSVPKYAAKLSAWIDMQDKATIESGTFVDWVNAAHDIANDHAYRDSKGKSLPKKGAKLADAYYKANITLVDQQLAFAGVRLAKVLNDALK